MNAAGVLGSLVAGLIFGLMVAWGTTGLIVAAVGVAVICFGSLIGGSLRLYFGAATLGFLFAWMVAGGLKVIGA